MNSETLRARILEAHVHASAAVDGPALVKLSALHFIERPGRPEFMRNCSSRLIQKVLSKKKVSPSMDVETKEWEVRFGKERDGPLDALEVLSLLKMCKRDGTLVTNLKTKMEYTSSEFESMIIHGASTKRTMAVSDGFGSPVMDITKMPPKHISQRRFNDLALSDHSSDGELEDNHGYDNANTNNNNNQSDYVNKYQNVLTKYSQSFNQIKNIDHAPSNNYQINSWRGNTGQDNSATKQNNGNYGSSKKMTSNRSNAYHIDSNRKIANSHQKQSEPNNYEENNKYNANTYKAPSNRNNVTRNVYASNYIGIPITQAYSWSTKKLDAPDHKPMSNRSNKFIEKVITKDEIKMMRQDEQHNNVKMNLIDQKEIRIGDINNKWDNKGSNRDVNPRPHNAKGGSNRKVNTHREEQKDQSSTFNRYKNISN